MKRINYKRFMITSSIVVIGLIGKYRGASADEIGNIVIDYEETSEFYNKAISADGKQVKVRAIPDYNGAVIGKMDADTIVDVELVNGGWTAVKCSDIKGFVRTSAIIRGYELEEYVEKHNRKFNTKGVILKNKVKVYKHKSLKEGAIDIVNENEEVKVIDYNDKLAKIKTTDKKVGYINIDDIEVNVKFGSIGETGNDEEDLSNIDEYTSEITEDSGDTSDSTNDTNNGDNNDDYIPAPSDDGNNSGITDDDLKNLLTSEEREQAYDYIPENETQMRREVLLYAIKFLGNPYVYGGESLTNGIDCSAYVQACYRHIGITIGRTSREQPAYGKEIDIKDIRPGDLLFYYKYGTTIGHVTMYLGNGKVIHASNPTDGIKISDITYRTPCKVVDIISRYDKEEEEELELE